MLQKLIFSCLVFFTFLHIIFCSNHDFSTDNLNIINDGPSNVCENQPTSCISYIKLFIGGFCGFILLYIFVRLAYFGKSQLGFKRDGEISSTDYLNILMGELFNYLLMQATIKE